MKFLLPWFWHYRCSGNRKTDVGLVNPALRALDASRGWDQEVIHRGLLPSAVLGGWCGIQGAVVHTAAFQLFAALFLNFGVGKWCFQAHSLWRLAFLKCLMNTDLHLFSGFASIIFFCSNKNMLPPTDNSEVIGRLMEVFRAQDVFKKGCVLGNGTVSWYSLWKPVGCT